MYLDKVQMKRLGGGADELVSFQTTCYQSIIPVAVADPTESLPGTTRIGYHIK